MELKKIWVTGVTTPIKWNYNQMMTGRGPPSRTSWETMYTMNSPADVARIHLGCVALRKKNGSMQFFYCWGVQLSIYHLDRTDDWESQDDIKSGCHPQREGSYCGILSPAQLDENMWTWSDVRGWDLRISAYIYSCSSKICQRSMIYSRNMS